MRPPLLLLLGLLLTLSATAHITSAAVRLDPGPRGSAAPHARILLNGTWQSNLKGATTSCSTRIPETSDVVERPRLVAWREVTIPPSWRGRGRVVLHFEKASHLARVSWNGNLVGEHYGTRTAFDLDVTPQVAYGAANRLEVRLESAWAGHAGPGDTSTDRDVVRWYVTDLRRSSCAMITGDVWVSLVPDVSVGSPRIEASLDGRVTATFIVTNGGESIREVEPTMDVARAGSVVAGADGPRIRLLPGAQETVTLSTLVRNPLPWGPAGFGTPTLYDLALSLREDGTTVERRWTRFGFRRIAIGADGRFWLNGKPLFIVGRRLPFQPPPFDEPHSLRKVFLEMQRNGFNAVESHDESRPAFFYEVADEVGMLVISGNFCLGEVGSMPLNRHVAGENALRDEIRAWVLREQSHPSVVMLNPCLGVAMLGDLVTGATREVDRSRLQPDDFAAMSVQAEAGPPPPQRVPTFLGEINLHDSDPRVVAAVFENLARRPDLLGIVANVDFGTFSATPTTPFPSAAALGAPRVDALDISFQAPPVPLARLFDSHPQDDVTLRALHAPPDVLVRVTRAGRPVRGALVLLAPEPGVHAEPRGALTEADGTALVTLPCDGPWHAECEGQVIRLQTCSGREPIVTAATFELKP